MFNEAVTGTNIVFYLMIAVGTIGVLAKVVNQITLRRMLKGAGNMARSTHKLIKLVRSKYEHTCMMNDHVENVEAFVEKYIYEYRGFLLKVHTWRQLEIQPIWFAGILAALGAVSNYLNSGFSEQVYRYIGLGAAEMILLFVISQMSDEHYKIEAVKNYMVDYLENVCARRQRKTRQTEKEQINVIQTEAPALRSGIKEKQLKEPPVWQETTISEEEAPEGLPINIEGEPRKAEKQETVRAGGLRKTAKEKNLEREEPQEQPSLKEETIRQILEEFLA